MLAINAKRGVESTLERVFNNAGGRFDTLEFVWSGSTAGIVFERIGATVKAKILFPAIVLSHALWLSLARPETSLTAS